MRVLMIEKDFDSPLCLPAPDYSNGTSTGWESQDPYRSSGLNRHRSRCVGELLNAYSDWDCATRNAVSLPVVIHSHASADAAGGRCVSYHDRHFVKACARGFARLVSIEL